MYGAEKDIMIPREIIESIITVLNENIRKLLISKMKEEQRTMLLDLMNIAKLLVESAEWTNKKESYDYFR